MIRLLRTWLRERVETERIAVLLMANANVYSCECAYHKALKKVNHISTSPVLIMDGKSIDIEDIKTTLEASGIHRIEVHAIIVPKMFPIAGIDFGKVNFQCTHDIDPDDLVADIDLKGF